MNVKLSDGKNINVTLCSSTELRLVINDLESQVKSLESELNSRQNHELSEMKKRHIAERAQKNKAISAINLVKSDVSALLVERKFKEKQAAQQETKKENILKANNEDRMFKIAARKVLSEDDFMRLVYLSEQLLSEFMHEIGD